MRKTRQPKTKENNFMTNNYFQVFSTVDTFRSSSNSYRIQIPYLIYPFLCGFPNMG